MSSDPSPFSDKAEQVQTRNARLEDIPAIAALCERVYGSSDTYSEAVLRGQQKNFSEGMFVVVEADRVIGYCATFIISARLALAPHTWMGITGGGYASRHDPDGDYLYGMDVFVDPAYRGHRIGRRLYNARKKLCQRLRLRGIVFGGRLPTLAKRLKDYSSVEEYVEAIKLKARRDPVLTFQLRNGFEILGILADYLPSDKESLGYAVHLRWRNPQVAPEDTEERRKDFASHMPDNIRVAAVQYQQRAVESYEEFLGIVEYFVEVTSDYRSDFVVFPELFALQLLSIKNQELSHRESIEALAEYTPRLLESFRALAVRFNINIIGGSHPSIMENGRVENICYVFLRDGSVHQQAKIHPTPNEAYWWNIEGGKELKPIETDCGSIGVLICYDSEFPELARHLVDQGAMILFVPFCTDERQSYLRVRYCCQARAVENQCYVVMAGNVGNLPRVANMDIQYAQSCVLTPCDFPFARDGIAADSTPNSEMVVFADLRPEALRMARNSGTVKNLKDRRFDLYRVQWFDKG